MLNNLIRPSLIIAVWLVFIVLACRGEHIGTSPAAKGDPTPVRVASPTPAPTPPAAPASPAELAPTGVLPPTATPTRTVAPTMTPATKPALTATSDSEDVTPPEILEVTVHPSQIDVGSGSAIVTLTIKVDDDLSGISRGELLFDSVPGVSGGSIFVIPPTTGDSNYAEHVWRVEYHQYFPAQTRRLLHAWIRDKAGNESAYSPGLLEELGLSASFGILPWEKEDNTPPDLIEVSILSPVVDVSDRFVGVDIIIRATDDSSGVQHVQLEFESPSGKHEAKMYAREEYFRGSPLDIVHKGQARVLQNSEAGIWQLKRVFIRDQLMNQRRYDVEELIALGLAATFEVVAARQDLEPPVLHELTLDSTEVNVTDGPASIGVTVRVTDDLSGVDRVEVDFESPSRDWQLTVGGVVMGWESSADGIFVGTLTVPQGSEAGTWNLKSISMTDHVGNREWYHPSGRGSGDIFASFQVVQDF